MGLPPASFLISATTLSASAVVMVSTTSTPSSPIWTAALTPPPWSIQTFPCTCNDCTSLSGGGSGLRTGAAGLAVAGLAPAVVKPDQRVSAHALMLTDGWPHCVPYSAGTGLTPGWCFGTAPVPHDPL